MDMKLETSRAYRESKAVLELIRSASKECPGIADTVLALLDTGILNDAVKYERMKDKDYDELRNA